MDLSGSGVYFEAQNSCPPWHLYPLSIITPRENSALVSPLVIVVVLEFRFDLGNYIHSTQEA